MFMRKSPNVFYLAGCEAYSFLHIHTMLLNYKLSEFEMKIVFCGFSYAYRSYISLNAHKNYACVFYQSIAFTHFKCEMFRRCQPINADHLIFYFALLCDEWNNIQQQHCKNQIYGKSARIENERTIPAWYLAEHIFVDASDYNNGRQTPLNIHLNVDPVGNNFIEN